MSSRIRDNAPFLQLLLTSHLPQQKALIESASDEQVDLLTEVIHNLLYVVPIAHSVRRKLQRKVYLKDLANIKRSRKFRKSHMRKRKSDLLKVLMPFASDLLALL